MLTSVNNSVTNQYGLYVPHDPFSPNELSAMAYHGVLRAQFGPYYVDADVPDTATQRAKAVRMAAEHVITGDWTATLLTAAWIHAGGQAPEMLEAGTAEYQNSHSRLGVHPAALRHVDYLQRPELEDDDLLVIGGVVVTNVALTIEDLLRLGGTPRHQSRALELTQMIDLDTLTERFRTSAHLPGMEIAIYQLEGLLNKAA